MAKITAVTAREILDSRGNPTLTVTVVADGGAVGVASVPSGASTGRHEARELRDGDQQRYDGKGVLRAVENVTTTIAALLRGKDPTAQADLDRALCAADGTPTKERLGGNAIVGVSMAIARCGARVRGVPLWQHIAHLAGRDEQAPQIPVPMFNIINGGKHADSGLAIQEFMFVPDGIADPCERIRAGAEVFHALQRRLTAAGARTGVGNEGGFAPRLPDTTAAFAHIVGAMEDAGYAPGTDGGIAIDAAANSFVQADGTYHLQPEDEHLDAAALIARYEQWCDAYPLRSIEDGVDEAAWDDWRALTSRLGDRVMLVGDDLIVTNPVRLREAIARRACTAVLIKPNQVGTVTETLETMAIAAAHDMACIVSHRSGDTCDAFIADLAVGAGAAYIKSGAPHRSERTAKYNRLLAIAQARAAARDRT